MNISGIEIGGSNPCRFVAEISCNHGGSLDRAFRLIEAAKDSGADFVKFQAYTAEELVSLRGDGPAPEPWGSQGWTMRSLYEKAQTPLEWFPKLFQHARDIGIVPFSSVFGLESLVVLEKCACPAYKIARLDNEKDGLIDAVRSRRKPVIISTDKLDDRAGYWPRADCWLYCAPGYPTDIKDISLPVWFGRQQPESYIGMSSHCLDKRLPVAAVARGCKLIEMHFQDAEESSELEANVSLYPHEFREMIANVRVVEEMISC
jgi:sialic acid synthase SpsE